MRLSSYGSVYLGSSDTHTLLILPARFAEFITLKIQTDELEKIQATSADNINMMVDSTVNWRIVDVEVAATMAAETMASSGKAGDISADITKLRRDVLKQALASLAAFIGSVNYSESFHMSAAAAGRTAEGPKSSRTQTVEGVLVDETASLEERKFVENPMYDVEKMGSSVEHANKVTRTVRETDGDLRTRAAPCLLPLASAEALWSPLLPAVWCRDHVNQRHLSHPL
mmetsp:Transcript_39512/g.104283  ORF Transcript_39512/g.104283 Transcript_39512/m.104283 type:complete len:228 (-) Transcript_39512:861-1544(-)